MFLWRNKIFSLKYLLPNRRQPKNSCVHVCVCICVCVYACMCVYVFMYVCVPMCVSLCVCVSMCERVCVCQCDCVRERKSVNVFVRVPRCCASVCLSAYVRKCLCLGVVLVYVHSFLFVCLCVYMYDFVCVRLCVWVFVSMRVCA